MAVPMWQCGTLHLEKKPLQCYSMYHYNCTETDEVKITLLYSLGKSQKDISRKLLSQPKIIRLRINTSHSQTF